MLETIITTIAASLMSLLLSDSLYADVAPAEAASQDIVHVINKGGGKSAKPGSIVRGYYSIRSLDDGRNHHRQVSAHSFTIIWGMPDQDDQETLLKSIITGSHVQGVLPMREGGNRKVIFHAPSKFADAEEGRMIIEVSVDLVIT